MLREPAGPLPIPARKAVWLALALAVLLPAAGAPAQSPPAAGQQPAPGKFDIRIPPTEERKPLVYELVRGVPAFKVTINGTEAWALLDNDAPGSVIDAGFARALGLQLTLVDGGMVTLSGRVERWRVPEVELVVPGQAGISKAPVSAIDLAGLSAVAGRPISLIFGKEYFEVLLFIVTPGNHQLRLAPSGALRITEGMRELVLRGERPDLEVMVNGRPAVLTVDLGNNGDIALGQAAWDRLGMTELPITPNLTASAAGSVSYSIATTADAVALGATEASDVKIALAPAVPEGRDGFIGFGLLSRFNFALDVKARRIWLIPPFPQTDEAEGGD